MSSDSIPGIAPAIAITTFGDSRGLSSGDPASTGPSPSTAPSAAPPALLAPSADPASSRAAAPPAQSAAEQAAQLAKTIQDNNAKLQSANIPLQFLVNYTPSGSVQSVKLLDSATNQVIMQIPSEAMVAISASIEQMIASDQNGSLTPGTLFSNKA